MGSIQKQSAGVAKSPSSPLQKLLTERRDQFALLLPEHIPPERFERVVLNAAIRNPDLMKADPASLYSAALQCAQDGLLPDGREAAMTTFKNRRSGTIDVTYIPMITGVIKRVMQSGDVLVIGSNVVYEGDEFDRYFENGEEVVFHRPVVKGPRGEMVGVYAFAKTHAGGLFTEFMSADDVAAVRQSSNQGNSEYGPWAKHPAQMWRKSVLHRLCRRLPMSADSQRILDRDNSLYDFDEPERVEPVKQKTASAPSASDSLKALQSATVEAPADDVIDGELVTDTSDAGFDDAGFDNAGFDNDEETY